MGAKSLKEILGGNLLNKKKLLGLIALIVLFNLPLMNHDILLKNEIAASNKKQDKIIYIDIIDKTLILYDLVEHKVIKEYSVAVGKYTTPSPIGEFTITSKEKWGKGFGTRFIGFNVPWGIYGIHGTTSPNSIGRAASHGCIRMHNEDVEELFENIYIGMTVILKGGPFGPFGEGLRYLKPGDRGSDVYEIQKILKDMNYYPYPLTGIYDDSMKDSILRFQEDNKMYKTHYINKELYTKLGIELFE